MQPFAGYGAPVAGYGAGAPPGRTYEFDSAQNLTITDVARYARLWGIISLVSGVVVLFLGIGIAVAGGAIVAAVGRGTSGAISSAAAVSALGIALVPSGVVSVVGGIFYLRSGGALKSVVDTQGNDIALLTDAVGSLTLAFKIEAIAMAFAFVIGLVIGVAGRVSGGQ